MKYLASLSLIVFLSEPLLSPDVAVRVRCERRKECGIERRLAVKGSKQEKQTEKDLG